MSKYLIIFLALVFSACNFNHQIIPSANPLPTTIPTPDPAQPISLLSESKARQIAAQSTCVDKGSLTNHAFYNSNSKTWWIDMEVENKPGCNPACVVGESGGVEINWRCTGLVTQ